jgi:hypothetical protein
MRPLDRVATSWAAAPLSLIPWAAFLLVTTPMVTSVDAQAGLAVLRVPFLAIPLAAVVSVGQWIFERRARPDVGEPGAPVGRSAR